MQTVTVVALDAMGGDNAPQETVKGAVNAVNARNDIKVLLVGQEASVKEELEKYTYPTEQIEIVDAPEVIEMAEKVTGQPIKIIETDRRVGDPAVLIASSKKAKAILGWEPKHDSLKEIIQTAWLWHKNHPNGYKNV